jgi:hypothetical protein
VPELLPFIGGGKALVFRTHAAKNLTAFLDLKNGEIRMRRHSKYPYPALFVGNLSERGAQSQGILAKSLSMRRGVALKMFHAAAIDIQEVRARHRRCFLRRKI